MSSYAPSPRASEEDRPASEEEDRPAPEDRPASEEGEDRPASEEDRPFDQKAKIDPRLKKLNDTYLKTVRDASEILVGLGLDGFVLSDLATAVAEALPAEGEGNKESWESLAKKAREEAGPAAECKTNDGKPTPGWTLAEWFGSLGLARKLADSLCKQIGTDDSKVQLSFARKLGTLGSRQAVHKWLGSSDIFQVLVDEVWQGVQDLNSTGAATSTELNAKFMQEENTFGLAYGDLSTFFSGLEGLVGAPDVNFEEAMARDHCDQKDSTTMFSTSNYHLDTTSIAEWYFVYSPEKGPEQAQLEEWPTETRFPHGKEELCRKPRPMADFAEELDKLNKTLEEAGEPNLLMEEMCGLRLYTGPMFIKYNGTLRGFASDFMKKKWEELCQGNKYTTTLHVINSGIVKCGKVMKAMKVYRGISGGLLPTEFWEPNKFNICGGVEFAFMSTTLDRSVATAYAGGGAVGTVFEINMGMVDRGADLAWVSQYPHEKEICFAPLTGLEVTSTHVEGPVLMVQVRLNINLSAMTIEQVLAKRHKVVIEMCRNLKLELDQQLGNQGWSQMLADLAPSNQDAICKVLKKPSYSRHEAIKNRESKVFNDDGQFLDSIKSVLDENAKLKAPTLDVLMQCCQMLDDDGQSEAALSLRAEVDKKAEKSEWTSKDLHDRIVDLLNPASGVSSADVEAVGQKIGALCIDCAHIVDLRDEAGFNGDSQPRLGPLQAKALFKGLQMHPTLKSLEFCWNDGKEEGFGTVGQVAGQEIGRLLETTTTLESVDVSQIGLCQPGSAFVFRGLEKNTSVKNYTSRYNPQMLEDDESVAAFARVLEKNSCLQDICMHGSGDQCPQEKTPIIVKALASNTGLTNFFLTTYCWGEASGHAWAETIAKNQTLGSVTVGEVDMSDEVKEKIKQAIKGRKQDLRGCFEQL